MGKVRLMPNYRRTQANPQSWVIGFKERLIWLASKGPVDYQTLIEINKVDIVKIHAAVSDAIRGKVVYDMQVTEQFIDREGNKNRAVYIVRASPEKARTSTAGKKPMRIKLDPSKDPKLSQRVRAKAAKRRGEHLANGTYTKEIEDEIQAWVSSRLAGIDDNRVR